MMFKDEPYLIKLTNLDDIKNLDKFNLSEDAKKLYRIIHGMCTGKSQNDYKFSNRLHCKLSNTQEFIDSLEWQHCVDEQDVT